jgi:iron-sulfur cluster assembly accessory protein
LRRVHKSYEYLNRAFAENFYIVKFRNGGMISITKKAAEEFKVFSEKEGKNGSALRVFVAGFGCGGPQYGMAFEEEAKKDDIVVEGEGIKIFVDKSFESFFDGATLDYQETEYGSGFLITNPNAPSGGGCGPSCSSCG